MNKKIRKEVFNKYKGHCAYCGCKLTLKDMQVDHITAKYLGGQDDISNLNPACRQCNFYKQTLTIEEFREKMGSLMLRVRGSYIYRLALKYRMVKEIEWNGKFYFEKLKEK